MIPVKKLPSDDQSWKAWLESVPTLAVEWADLIEKATEGRKRLIDDFDNDRELKVNAALYSRYKEFLTRLFNGKCAYCESKFTVSQPGDVEHFRPKGRVVDESFKPIRVKHPVKGDIEHPGYYWLAYDWRNLLPSCADCNRFRFHGVRIPSTVSKAAEGAGKADRFPLKDEKRRAVVPDAETAESPMLINPTDSDPNVHFEFLSNGTIKPKTPEGEVTLSVFGLNLREDLLEARAHAFDDAEANFDRYIDSVKSRNSTREKQSAQRINQMLEGKEAYSVMQKLAILGAVQYLAERNIRIELPVRIVD